MSTLKSYDNHPINQGPPRAVLSQQPWESSAVLSCLDITETIRPALSKSMFVLIPSRIIDCITLMPPFSSPFVRYSQTHHRHLSSLCFASSKPTAARSRKRECSCYSASIQSTFGFASLPIGICASSLVSGVLCMQPSHHPRTRRPRISIAVCG